MAQIDEDDFEPTKGKKLTGGEDDFEDNPPKGKKKVVDSDDVADVSFGDEKLMKRKVVCDRLTVDPGKWVRFAFIPGLALKAACQHYVEKKGNFRCLSTEDQEGICCKKLGPVDPTFVGLVVHYTNADPTNGKLPVAEEGKPPIAPEIAIMHVRMSQSLYREISSLPDEDSTPYAIDIAMSMKPGKKGYIVRRMASTPRWKKDENCIAQVKEWVGQYKDGKMTNSKFGKKITLAEWRAMLAGIAADAGEEEDEGDFHGGMDDI